MSINKKPSRLQVLVDGYEVELRTPDGEMLRGAINATLNMTAGERPTLDVTFVMPSIAADVAVHTCWLECPLCGASRMHRCDEEEDEYTFKTRPTIWRPPLAAPSITPAASVSPSSP